MLTYIYTALDSQSGKKVKAEVEAENEQAAAKLLVERGLSPLDIKVQGEQGGIGSLLKRVKAKDRVIFSRQLSTLINAGLPLVQSLRNVAQQTGNNKLKDVINKVINDVEAGSSLADALARHPKVFDSLYVSMVAAGETSGTLDKSLERLANQQEKDAEIISKVRGALVYPLIVLLAMGGVVIFMITTVLPQVQGLYEQLPGVSLPFITVILLKISHLIINFWWILALVLVGLGFTVTHWARTEHGKSTIDHLKMHLWPIGPLFMKIYMARFTSTASTLVASGVPLLKMLSTAADAVGNVHIAASIRAAAEKVKGGKALSECLAGDPNFLELVPDMIRTGEQSGALEQMFNKVATYYEKEVDNQIKTISTTVEPVLMIIVGIIALIIVAAVLLPIYGLVGKFNIRQ